MFITLYLLVAGVLPSQSTMKKQTGEGAELDGEGNHSNKTGVSSAHTTVTRGTAIATFEVMPRRPSRYPFALLNADTALCVTVLPGECAVC